MQDLHRLTSREPLWIFAVLWPLVFLAPLFPGLPKGAISSFPWRQELVVALLLVISLALTLKQATKSSNCSIHVQRVALAIHLALVSLVVWSAVSLLWAQGWFHAAYYNLSWIAYVMCFVLMQRIALRPRLLRLSLAALAVAVSIIGIASAIEFWSTPPAVYQYGLLLRRSTGLGEPLAVTVPIFAILAISLRKRRAALLCGVTAILAWLTTLQSLERAPMFGLGAGLILLVGGMIAKKAWRPRRPSRVLLFIAVLVATSMAQSLNTSSSFTRFQELKSKDASTQVRLLVWAIGLEMLREHPLRGVGANNYELAYPAARGQFSSRHPDSVLVGSQEELMAQRAHNEYIQILAELGFVGFALFVLFCAGLIWLAFKALRSARNPLALGAVCSLTTFAISSGASSVSFRWLGSGLLFFFASAITLRFASIGTEQIRSWTLTPAFRYYAAASGLVLALVLLGGAGALGINSTLRGMALARAAAGLPPESSSQSDSPENLFRAALRWNPYDGPTHFDFGAWLYGQRRYRESLQHLRLATERGFNSSTCYAFQAGAEAAAGEASAAEQTLARAVAVYPRSVFLRVRHAIALAEAGKPLEAGRAYDAALSLDAPAARGWRQLMCFGPDSAYAAANRDTRITAPKDLRPASWAYPAIAEHAIHPPVAYPAEVASADTF
jgi:O-antigen ligase